MTKNGKSLVREIGAFKLFLEDFSNLEEETIKSYPLWGEYLSYSIILNVNNDYKKFRLNDNQYRFLTSEEYMEKALSFIENLSKLAANMAEDRH